MSYSLKAQRLRLADVLSRVKHHELIIAGYQGIGLLPTDSSVFVKLLTDQVLELDRVIAGSVIC
jgi:hypothetical protein